MSGDWDWGVGSGEWGLGVGELDSDPGETPQNKSVTNMTNKICANLWMAVAVADVTPSHAPGTATSR